MFIDSFRMRLAVLFGGLSLAFGLAMMAYVYQAASAPLGSASGAALTSTGKAVANVLASTLVEREREIRLLSRRAAFMDKDLPGIRAAIDQVQGAYRHYAWIGYADREGVVRAAGGGLLEGAHVDQRPWFVAGRKGPFVGDVHEAVMLAKTLQSADAAEPLRFVDFAAPVFSRAGELLGVVATHAHWAWVREVLESALPVDAAAQGIEAFIVGSDGAVLYPYASMGVGRLPAGLPEGDGHRVVDWPGEGAFLTSHVRVRGAPVTDLGWRIIVRQPVDRALAEVDALQRKLLWLGIGASLVFVLVSYRLAGELSRPIEALAESARRIRAGDAHSLFHVDRPPREVSSLATSLQGMTRDLLMRKQALREINATLEQKVRERTAALQAANQELARLSRHDALTGLHNRLAANEALRREFLRMKRSGRCYAVLMLDVDHFKRVNDGFGHAAGDAVLEQIAGILTASVRATDVVARFGGEEFIAILPDTDAGGATIAEKIRAAVAVAEVPPVGRVSVSIGVAVAGPADADEDVALRAADGALYRAKATGRNRVCAAMAVDGQAVEALQEG